MRLGKEDRLSANKFDRKATTKDIGSYGLMVINRVNLI